MSLLKHSYEQGYVDALKCAGVAGPAMEQAAAALARAKSLFQNPSTQAHAKDLLGLGLMAGPAAYEAFGPEDQSHTSKRVGAGMELAGLGLMAHGAHQHLAGHP